MTAPTIGVIGIGNMGWPMAARLVAAGHLVHVYDTRDQHAVTFAQEVGGVPADSIKALAESSDVVITMLPNSAIVEATLFAADGVSAGAPRGAVVIEMSSGMPSQTAAFGARLAEQGVAMIDAPVSGGVRRARTGELSIMVGGDETVVKRCEPILLAMGKALIRTGPLGSGQAMKALNNLVSAGGFLIGIEAVLIGKRFGLDPNVIVEALNASTGINNSTQNKFKQFVFSGAYNSGFGLDLMVKDIATAMTLANDAHMSVPFSALCKELWQAAATRQGPAADHTELAEFAGELAGMSLSTKMNGGPLR